MIDWLLRPEASPLQIDVAGKVLPLILRRVVNARRMTMRLSPDGSEVRITLPKWGRSADALEFAQARMPWLAEQLEKVSPPAALVDGAAITWCGQSVMLCHNSSLPRRVTLDGERLRVGGSAESLTPRLRRWMEAEARRMFTADLAEYCERAGKSLPRLMLTSARRRWGSCARNGTIRLNWRLAMAPPAIRRSVVAHEVAHLVHFDHSGAFHALLGQLYEGNLAEANRWLKRHGRSLYSPFG